MSSAYTIVGEQAEKLKIVSANTIRTLMESWSTRRARRKTFVERLRYLLFQQLYTILNKVTRFEKQVNTACMFYIL